MLAIYKREMRAYFTTFIGYVFIATFLLVSSIIFVLTTLSQGESADVTTYYTFVMLAFAILIPLLTMKLFADEKRLRTEVLLLTSPVSLLGIVSAKFLAALTVFVSTFLISCVNLIPLYLYGNQNTAVIIGNIISVLLVGSAFIAVGVFMSCLTENQLVAAVTTIAAIALFLVIGMYSSGIGFAPLRAVLDFLSVFNRFTYFTYGVIDWSALVYYASISFVFLFLTVRVYERRRWA